MIFDHLLEMAMWWRDKCKCHKEIKDVKIKRISMKGEFRHSHGRNSTGEREEGGGSGWFWLPFF